MRFIFCFLLYGVCFSYSSRADNLNDALRYRADSAFRYCKEHQLDTTFCILINMGKHSGKNRLFVWDFKRQAIVRAGLVCHGIGKGSTPALPVFSNIPESYCTSLGKYRVGKRGYSNWGIHVLYRLHGLENSNSNAFKRLIVLHSHTPVPSGEIYPQHIPMGYSLGCPVVSEALMRDLDTLLQNIPNSVLLWIYFDLYEPF